MIERAYYCDGPDCERFARTASPPPYLPIGFIETRGRTDAGDDLHHFCGWGCAMKFAADQPVEEVIPWEAPDA